MQRRRLKGPDIYCHLVTGRRHEKEVISEKPFKSRGQMAARERRKYQWERGSKMEDSRREM